MGPVGVVDLLQRNFGRSSERERQRRTSYAGAFTDRKVCPHRLGGYVQCYPDLMVIGASKCATSSIVAYMLAHPQVIMQTMDSGKSGWSNAPSVTVPGFNKSMVLEAHVFDTHTTPDWVIKHSNWVTAPWVPSAKAGDYLQLHYTPNYIYHPSTPFHVLDIYPNAKSIKYIVVVREPVKRAISGWKYHQALTGDLRSFSRVVDDGVAQRRALEKCYAEALQRKGEPAVKFVEDLAVNDLRQTMNSCFWGRHDTHDRTINTGVPVALLHAHVDKGVYADQLRRWFRILGRENFLVFSLEEWSADNEGMYAKVAAFSGYAPIGRHGFKNQAELHEVLQQRYNEGGGSAFHREPPEPDVQVKRRLAEFYEPYNEQLFELVGRRLWNVTVY